MAHSTPQGESIAPSRPAIIYSVAVSLDGFVATPDGGSGWLAPFMRADRAEAMSSFQDSIEAVILGSRSYEPALAFGGDPFGAMGRPCWVLSSRSLPSTGPLVTITPATPEDVVDEIASRGISRIWLMGGPRLATSFRRANLITEYELGVIPVVLGSGLPLLESPGPMSRLQLIESKAYSNGVVHLRYSVA
jgi:dihydrofolate reductase